MHYLLGGQQFYFPSSDEQSYTLQEFLDNKYNNEYSLPTIVRITSINIHGRSIKNLLSKNIPLLLLDTYQFESILAEYHRSNDGKYHSTRHRFTSTQAKIASKTTNKFRTMKKLSTSLVTLTKTNLSDDNSDDDYENMRIIIRNLNQNRSSSIPLCRIPMNYHGFFELLNENDQAIEPFYKLSNLIIKENKNDDNNNNKQQIYTEKWPQAFYLRSTCIAYTKRYIPDERKLSGSADSCYGSLSDLDLHKSLLILNDERITLQPGQIITIISQCSAYRSQTHNKELKTEQFESHSSTSWFRNKSRFFFLRKKAQPSHSSKNQLTNSTKNIYDISKKSEPYLKCQTEQGDIVYISIHESGLFSPLNSQNYRSTSITESENLDITGVFQLQDLLSNFRFPISVNLLNNSILFDNIYSPASINQNESSPLSLTKFRLLLPYTENVIFVCPLVIPSSFKSEIIVIPIPLNSDIEIQRCLNMREILKNKYFHNLIQTCTYTINQFKTKLSYIHFPLVLNTTTKQLLKRKHPLFKKRSQSESHLEYYASNLTKRKYRRSCDVFNHHNDDDDNESDIENNNLNFHPHEQLYHRDSFEKIKQKLSNNLIDNNPRQQTTRRSGHYAKIKTDKVKKYSRQQEYDSEDENYRDLDHIYDYIRSGDVTDDVQRIQAKEKALNTEYNQRHNTSQVCQSTVVNVPNSKIKQSEKKISPTDGSPTAKENHRFPHNLDDSRPFNESDEDIPDIPYLKSRRRTTNTLPESTNSKPISKTNRLSKQ
ncbi:unnamed protein product [Rotaria sp. Silwood1]|nr:unnamed protein product [Rotaria sp. Silwood1]CAF1208536.1 unnamed protein product [Rotaria sp. Silwood1]CAF3440828.1 unnamed protein product [Rotaria sp. Silwood1]CAF3480853.1 unnamed protein product [Rotaria sp. Silwood1]CAF4490996.1 unnamed protein product [Rotaria sp. Silwood1]